MYQKILGGPPELEKLYINVVYAAYVFCDFQILLSLDCF